MSDEEPHRIGEAVEEVLLKIIRPDLLEQYQQEKERHRKEHKQIDQMRKRTGAWIKRTFRSPLRERKLTELDEEYMQRAQSEDDRHDQVLQQLRETIRDASSTE